MNRPPPAATAPPLSMAENDAAALAAEMFDHFSAATTMRQILGLYRNMCDTIGLRAAPINEFYPKLRSRIKTWKAQALWKKFDARASHRVYNKGTACRGTRVLVIGAGPCGLRTAIEAQLLGAKVVVVEKRDRISRNNVLHLWPFLITDLRNLGAKKFYGKFCAGSIDHISIRQLQCILLKVALLLGVEVHEGISFERVLEPSDGCGWRAAISPDDHAVSHYEFDVLIGADGKRNTLAGFRRKEFRGKLAIAITANFCNKRTEAEAKAEEISGVAFIFNQAFFKELYATTGIDLENIVYYKDDTHYFVMTAKKHSLIDKGVIVQDSSDPAELLASANVNTDRLLDYAREAAQFSTKFQMPNLEFAVNHYGNPDVAMFDFTSMFAAEQSCSAVVRKNYRLLQCLVGDSLLEPFWPTGSGCARGFLSSMDAAYAMKLWNNPKNSVLSVLAQRESIYRLLAQTTPENLHRDIGAYTLDPATRYPNLNRNAVSALQVRHMLNTDDAQLLEQTFVDTSAAALASTLEAMPLRRKRRTGDTLPLSTVLLRWIKAQLLRHGFAQELTEVSECFTHGQVLCALINRYRPDLVDLTELKEFSVLECNELAFGIVERELLIPRVMSAEESLTLEGLDARVWLSYLEQVCEVFRGEIPHVKHPKLDFADLKDKPNHRAPNFSRHSISKYRIKSPTKEATDRADAADTGGGGGEPSARRVAALAEDDDRGRRVRRLYEHSSASPLDVSASKRSRKRRSHDKSGNVAERVERQQEIAANRNDRQNRRRLMRAQQTQNFYKSLHMLQANTMLRESDSSVPFEDYSIYMYRQSAPEFGDRVKELERKLLYPDRERGIASAQPRDPDAQFNDRIKSMEHKITANKQKPGGDKKPKDLLRAIGRIESSDWNIREIEKKIELSRKTEVGKSREKVPKWSKEQFLQRQTRMARPQEPGTGDEKFRDIDQTIRNLDKQLRDGSNLERGQRGKNKVASIAGTFGKRSDDRTAAAATADVLDHQRGAEKIGVQKSNSKSALVFAPPAACDMCHFCKQKVYLMEKISAEGLLLHRACLKCHHCHTSLRLGGYAFDRDDPNGRFYCTQHYRLPAKVQRPIPRRSVPRSAAPVTTRTAAATATGTAAGKERHPETPEQIAARERREGQTPERIEFENVEALSDGEPSLHNIIDENEWTDRNFGTGTDDDTSESDLSDSDDDDSADSDSDSGSGSAEYEEAEGSPLDAHTLKLANDWIGQQRYSSNDEEEFYDSSDDDADSQTEGEDLERARQMRMDEVKLKPLPDLPTDTETEVQSDSDSSSPVAELNSATEISTDSEFEQDPVSRHPLADEAHLKKPTRVQIKQSIIENGSTRHQLGTHASIRAHPQPSAAQPHHHQRHHLPELHIEFKPLVQVDPSLLTTSASRLPLQNPRAGDYLLNKTSSTEGIASKKSLELKKRYLLGESTTPSLTTVTSSSLLGLMKSDSTSVLDSKFRHFHSNISAGQKMLAAPTSPSGLVHSATTTDMNPVIQSFMRLSPNTAKAAVTASTTTASASPAISQSTTTNTTASSSPPPASPAPPKNECRDVAPNAPSVTLSDEKENVNDANRRAIVVAAAIPVKTEPSKGGAVLAASTPPTPTGNAYETIDLCTPPHDRSPEIRRLNLAEEIRKNEEFMRRLDQTTTSGGVEVIDLTTDEQLPLMPSTTTATTTTTTAARDKVAIDTMLASRQSRPPTTVATIVGGAVDMDSLSSSAPCHSSGTGSSSSTTSSVDDIPHYVLDSTTSPDTQPLVVADGVKTAAPPASASPSLLPDDAHHHLMQIDSLMIIDGKYVGDPDDLPHMQMPDGQRCPLPVQPPLIEPPLLPIRSPFRPAAVVSVPNTSPPSALPSLRYESSAAQQQRGRADSRRRFDTRNENKIDTLKSMPPLVKPTLLELRPVTSITAVDQFVDMDKTPTAPPPPTSGIEMTAAAAATTVPAERHHSDSDADEVTGAALTETELSDWAADDVVSENFVDIEFALNSNMGTIRRNKKKKHHQQQQQHNQHHQQHQHHHQHVAPSSATSAEATAQTATLGARHLALEEIEFMDTGSEDSCMETFSATNQAMLRNRGYVQFVENGACVEDTRHGRRSLADATMTTSTKHEVYGYKSDAGYGSSPKDSLDRLGMEEVLERPGVDYIEQGACILGNDIDLRTPMNEQPPAMFGVRKKGVEQPDSLLDIDDDSLVMLGGNSQTAITAGNTTTDSDALTVVTSPVDSVTTNPVTEPPTAPEQQQQQQQNRDSTSDRTTTASTMTSTTTTSESPARADDDDTNATNRSSSLRSSSLRSLSLRGASEVIVADATTAAADVVACRPEECSYEEYVRKLQLKISQISNARDSIDIRKTKRRHSKGDPALTTTVLAPVVSPINSPSSAVVAPNTSTTIQKNVSSLEASCRSLSIFVDKPTTAAAVAAPPVVVDPASTVNERISEISKERAKQKDLIHDLVMDKLQSKKQLNAEKRLNRSRNRNSMFGGASPTTTGTNAAPQAAPRHHEAPIVPAPAGVQQHQPRLRDSPAKTPRPHSEYYGNEPPGLATGGTPACLAKTQSFCVYATGDGNATATPVPPPRRNRPDDAAAVHTELLRQDARARARLKSNQALGISPEEKVQLLRRRLLLAPSTPDAVDDDALTATPLQMLPLVLPLNKSDDMKVRERKMMASKSVNDIASVLQHQPQMCNVGAAAAEATSSTTTQKQRPIKPINSDYTSDPNLCDGGSGGGAPVLKRRTATRSKDPERRKSIISYVSDLFHKRKAEPVANGATTASSTATSSSKGSHEGGVFGRFRISPKAKSKNDRETMNSHERCRSEDLLHTSGGRDEADASGDLDEIMVLQQQQQPPPIPPLPVNYQRSDDESCSANESREQKKHRAHTKAHRQAELKRLRIAQEIQREQEEIEVHLKELEARGVLIEKALRGEGQNFDDADVQTSCGANDDRMVKELLEIWRNITQFKKRDEELNIRQQELQLEHRHAQLKDQLNTRLSCSRLDKGSSDVAAEGAILNEMLEIVAKRASLRHFDATTVGNSAGTTSDTRADDGIARAAGSSGNRSFESEI